MIELHAFLSKKVAENALSAGAKVRSGDYVPFKVNPTKPFEDDANYPKLAQALGITGACDLCSFVEGVIGEVIDKSRTPDELGFRPRMGIYIRQKKVRREQGADGDGGSGGGNRSAGSRKIGNISLTTEEEVLYSRLKDILSTTLTPEQPCPMCSRLGGHDEDDGNGRRGGAYGDRGGGATAFRSAPSNTTGNSTSVIFALKADVGVQCGSASRVGAPLMPVSFGTAARMRAMDNDSIRGGPVDFPAPSTLGGAAFLNLEGEVTDLKMDRDKLKLERDQLAAALRDEQRKVVELHRERQDHKCEGSVKVQEYIKEIERLQVNLRDLARGREEAHALLTQRRTSGAVLEGPRPYAPFALSVPVGEPTPAARSLLAKDLKTVRQMPPGDHPQVTANYASDNVTEDTDLTILKHPSGHYAVDDFSTNSAGGVSSPYKAALSLSREPPGCKEQPANQCFLRVVSSTGDTYNVKRLVSSAIIRGSYTFVLSSMDRTVTDELPVDDLETVSVLGNYELVLSTRTNEWVLFLNAADRQRWVHWLYALNPWLSAQKGNLLAPV